MVCRMVRRMWDRPWAPLATHSVQRVLTAQSRPCAVDVFSLGNRGGTCLSPMVGSLRPRCHSDSAQWYDGQGSGGGTRFLPEAPGDPPGQPRYAEGHRPLYRNRTNKHIVPGAGLWYRGASCRTGLSCYIVTYEDPADTNVHAITRMGWSGPARTALRGQCPVL